MNKFILPILIFLCAFSAKATESHTSYVYHSFTVRDRNFNVQEELQGNGNPLGLIITADIDGIKMIGVTVGEDSAYEVQIVNTIENDDFLPGMKCTMYQGGMKFQGEIVVINFLFLYDTDKNTEIPEYVFVDVNNSPTIIELSGLVKLQGNK